MKKVQGTYRDIRKDLPEEVRHVLDHIVPPTANVDMTELKGEDLTDGCSFMPCGGKCDDCPIDKGTPVANVGAYVDCIDVELKELAEAVNYKGEVMADRKAAAISSLKQITDAAMHALSELE